MRKATFLVFLNFTGIILLLQRGFIEALDNVGGSSDCIEYKKEGCFWDTTEAPRPLPELIANFRGFFDWNDAEGTINRDVSQCSKIVSQRGFTIFGLQFYGECWSGENATQTYARDGHADKCVMVVNNNTEFQQCDDNSDKLCAGVKKTNYVYRIIPPADGKFSAWSDWSLCSASCDGGQQKRTRSCNNPTPSKCGIPCTGYNEEAVVCNTQSCPAPEVCEDMFPKCPYYKSIGLCTKDYEQVLERCKKSCGKCT